VLFLDLVLHLTSSGFVVGFVVSMSTVSINLNSFCSLIYIGKTCLCAFWGLLLMLVEVAGEAAICYYLLYFLVYMIKI
jgi:hypothetical protein